VLRVNLYTLHINKKWIITKTYEWQKILAITSVFTAPLSEKMSLFLIGTAKT
jgi:hypothetical protein